MLLSKTNILIILIIIMVIFIFYNNLYSSTLVSTCTISTDTSVASSCRNYSVSSKFKDTKQAAKLMDDITKRVETLISHMKKYPILLGFSSSDIKNGVRNIEKRFSPDRLYEINPGNFLGYTAYTQNKKEMMLCLRNKDGHLYNINIMMFVVLHELAHMMNDDWDHDQRFWDLFRLLLVNATYSGIYTPTNFAMNPVNYCGLELTNNPFYEVHQQQIY